MVYLCIYVALIHTIPITQYSYIFLFLYYMIYPSRTCKMYIQCTVSLYIQSSLQNWWRGLPEITIVSYIKFMYPKIECLETAPQEARYVDIQTADRSVHFAHRTERATSQSATVVILCTWYTVMAIDKFGEDLSPSDRRSEGGKTSSIFL